MNSKDSNITVECKDWMTERMESVESALLCAVLKVMTTRLLPDCRMPQLGAMKNEVCRRRFSAGSGSCDNADFRHGNDTTFITVTTRLHQGDDATSTVLPNAKIGR